MQEDLKQSNSRSGEGAQALTLPAKGIIFPPPVAIASGPIGQLLRQWETNHGLLLELLTTKQIGTLDRIILCSVPPSALEEQAKPAPGKFTVVRVHDSSRTEQALMNLYKAAWHASHFRLQAGDRSQPSSHQAVLVFEAPDKDQGYQPIARLETRRWTPIPGDKANAREHFGVPNSSANSYAGTWKGTMDLTQAALEATFRGISGRFIRYPSSLDQHPDVLIRAEMMHRLRGQEVAYECIKLLGIQEARSKPSEQAA